VYWNPIDCSRPYTRRPSCTTSCSTGRVANVRCSSYAIVLAKRSKTHRLIQASHHVIDLQTYTNTPVHLTTALPVLPVRKFILGDAPHVHLRTDLVSETHPSPPFRHSPVSFLLTFRNDIPALPIDRARIHKMLVQMVRIFNHAPFHRPRD